MADETNWPENPDAGWLGEWAAENDHLIPDPMSLATVRRIYQRERENAAEAAYERQQQSLMESGGPDDSAYRRDMIAAGRGHLLR